MGIHHINGTKLDPKIRFSMSYYALETIWNVYGAQVSKTMATADSVFASYWLIGQWNTFCMVHWPFSCNTNMS
jgi:hypothetical protein